MTSNDEIQEGDQVFCEKKQLRGFITRKNALGFTKTTTVGVHWENGKRETLFGDACRDLKKMDKP